MVISTNWRSLKAFSREAFERSARPEDLCNELQAVLLRRLIGASDQLREAHAIVDNLAGAGHVLWCWAESQDFSIWGDDYRNPPLPTRFSIEMRWPSEDEPALAVEIVVTFGPWPRADP